MDLARRSPEYIRELTRYHVGGHLKVAPEHVDPDVLFKMRKPANDDFEYFSDVFREESSKAGKKQFLIPYFIASHPASDMEAMINLAVFLKQNGYKPDQVQDFIPAPLDVATCMYYTELDPFTLKPVYIAKKLRDRKTQRALMQFFKPENYFEVREALRAAKRHDLIGDGCDALIPATPPKEALDRRRREASDLGQGNYVHTIKSPKARPSGGNRPSAVRPGGFRPSSHRTGSSRTGSSRTGDNDQDPKKSIGRPVSSKQGRIRSTKGYRPGRKGAQDLDRRDSDRRSV
jgi:hypothetical protein